MKRTASILAALLLLASSAQAGTIKYIGSSTVGKFITDASKVYKTSSFKINTIPESSGGEKCAAKGSCTIGGVARGVNSEFLNKGAVATLIGKDAIAVVVHPSNPVKGLTTAQAAGIFSGKIKNWKEVGGADLKITAYVVKKGSATRKVFKKVILGSKDYKGVKVITPDAKMITTVGRNKGGIGQISFAFLTSKSKARPLNIDGQKATVENPNYPITRPLNLVTKGQPSGDAKAFINWALSPAGQAVVKKRFVGVK